MNAVLQTPLRLLLSITSEELTGICNALNEVCHGVSIEEPEFQTRLGVSRTFLSELLIRLEAGANDPARQAEARTSAWADGGSVQAICITVHGDPADLSSEEARVLAEQLQAAITEADG